MSAKSHSRSPDSLSVNHRVSRALQGFGPIGIATFLIILFLGPPWFRGILVLIWAIGSCTPWINLGFVRPKSWTRTVLMGIVLGLALKFLCKAVIMPLLGADPINRAYHYIAGNPGALAVMLVVVIVSGGFGEEMVFRGYFFDRAGKLLGRTSVATALIVLISSAIFALQHYPDQRLPGVEQAFVTGLVFGTIFAVTRELWLVIVAHAAFDIAALGIIYYDVESKIAHLLFR